VYKRRFVEMVQKKKTSGRDCELTLEWERREEKARKEGIEIGGLVVILKGLLKTTNQAKGLAKKYNKNVCYYLRMSLRNNWLKNCCCSMWNLEQDCLHIALIMLFQLVLKI